MSSVNSPDTLRESDLSLFPLGDLASDVKKLRTNSFLGCKTLCTDMKRGFS